MSKNAASGFEPATSMVPVRPQRRGALRGWLAKPGGGARGWIKLAVAVVLITILLSFVDWRESLLLLGDVRLLPALYASGLLVVGLTLSTLKWQVLLAAHGIFLSLLRLLKCYWIGSFFSMFLPSNVGGDVVRLALLHRHGLTIVGASIVVERLTGLFVVLCLATLGLGVLSHDFAEGKILLSMWLLVVGLSCALSLAVILVSVAMIPGGRIWTLLSTSFEPDRLLGRFILALFNVTDALAYYRQQTGPIAIAILISVLFYMSMILFQYSVILAIGGNISLLDVAFIAPLIALVSFIPISVNALGLAEGAFVLFFTQAGLSPEEALAVAVLRRVLTTAYSLVGGVVWLREKPSLQSVQ